MFEIFAPLYFYSGAFSGVLNLKTKDNIKKISVIGMLCAVAYLCMFLFKFKISFLTFDLKDAFLAIIAFLYGPLYSIVSAILVAVLEFLSVSDTGIYGLIMNALSSAAFAGTCGAFYKYKRTFNGAVTGAIAAVLVMTAIMLVANWFITPYYMGVARGQVAAMIPTLLLPFNLIKGVVNMGLTLIIYKPVTAAFKKTGLITVGNYTNKKKFTVLSIISAILIILCILFIFVLFDGEFQLFG
ncbi:MAG: ECF transporter S component [Clostridia bacterium]|nr:ECF transporter S component [Clostridia bacterium]